ncbi:hypothetical protein CDN98_02485 [Roseateles terrae]|nr:hypothetical protein CDN98_02485 [Roseateles terrae]
MHQAAQGAPTGAELVQHLGQRGLLPVAQVQEGGDVGLQALAVSAIGAKAQACTEAGPTTRVVASPMARPMSASKAASMSRAGGSPGAEATVACERPAPGRQGAVGASVRVSAERIEPAIKAVVVTVMFMVTAPATKQMHGESPW